MKIKIIIVALLFLISGSVSFILIYQSFTVLAEKTDLNGKKNIDYEKIKTAIEIAFQKKPFSLTAEESASSESASQIKAAILNGSGISGAAASLKNKLEEIENVEVITTGNVSPREKNIVSTKKDLSKEIKSAIVSLVENDFGEVETKDLDESETADVVIELGS